MSTQFARLAVVTFHLLSMGAGVALGGGDVQPGVTVLFTTSALDDALGTPLSTTQVPGLPGEHFSSLRRPYVSPDGMTWGFTAFLDEKASINDVLVIVGPDGAQTVIREGVTPLPDVEGETVGSLDEKVSINDAGCYGFRTEAPQSFEDVVAVGCGSHTAGAGTLTVIARQGNAIPGDPEGRPYSFGMKEVSLHNDRTVDFIARILGAPSDQREHLFETADNGQTVAILLQQGVSVPTDQAGGAGATWSTFENESFRQGRGGLYVTGDGLNMLLSGRINGDTEVNDILALNNAVVVQEGSALGAFKSPVAGSVGGIFLAPNGHWYARGSNADGQHWVVRNGTEVLAQTGDEIFPGAGERWAVSGSRGFNVIAGDADGNLLIAGTTDAAPDPDSFRPPQAMVLNGTTLIAHTGDPVDIDGDGTFTEAFVIDNFDFDAAVFIQEDIAENVVAAATAAPRPPRRPAKKIAKKFAVRKEDSGKTPVGGSVVTSTDLGRCCLPDGSCLTPTSFRECIFRDGSFSRRRNCEGDTNGDGIDDSCKDGACCSEQLTDSQMCGNGFTRGTCADVGGTYRGDGTFCLGDDNGNDVDDQCEACSGTTAAGPSDCDDGNPCTNDLCGKDGFCRHDPVECDDAIDCTDDSCNSVTGECGHEPNSTLCDDGDPCNGIEMCDPDTGCQLAKEAPNCDDGIDCTVDFCDKDHILADPFTGCVNEPDNSLCAAEDPCVVEAICDLKQGCLVTERDCSDEFHCTFDLCDSTDGQCAHVPIDGRCDDDNDCTADSCDPENSGANLLGCVHVRTTPSECGNGDMNGDGNIDGLDYFPGAFLECFVAEPPLEPSCASADLNGDNIVDMRDTAEFFRRFGTCGACEGMVLSKETLMVICAFLCGPDEDCALDGSMSGAAASSAGLESGGTGECRRPCENNQDCFRASQCESCVEGHCRPRCEVDACSQDRRPCTECDGAGNCRSCCTEDEVCFEGECVPRECETSLDCDREHCFACEDGRCEFQCDIFDACVLGPSGGSGLCATISCKTDEECPECNLCLPAHGFCTACDPAECDRCPDCKRCGPDEVCTDGACVLRAP